RASLRIEPNMTIGSIRYDVTPGTDYTLSFYARAEPSGPPSSPVIFHALTPTWKAFSLRLEAGKDIGPEWKRYAIPVRIEDQKLAFRNTLYMRIDSQDNTVWVDAVQLEKGGLREYQSGPQAGLRLDSETGLLQQGRPETAALTVSASGGSPPLTASLVARDAQDQILWSRSVRVPETEDSFLSIPVVLDPRKLGVHDVTISLMSDDGITVSQTKTRYAVIEGEETIALNLLIGTENVIGRFPAWVEAWNERMANAAGSRFTRVFTWKSSVGDGADDATLASLRRQLSIKKDSGKFVMICVGLPNHANLSLSRAFDAEPTEAQVEEDLAAYALYAGKLAAALREVVDVFQLLNEPNIWSARSGSRKGLRLMPPERYVRYLAAGSRAIREAAPFALVAANINGTDVGYTDRLFAARAAEHIDVFTFHSYRASPESPPAYEDIRRLRAVLDRYAPAMPIFNDEQYFGVRDRIAHSGEDDRDYFSDSEEEFTGRVLQNYLHHIAADRVPYALFSVQSTLVRQGIGGPAYFYPTFGGVRFISRLLLDITASRNVEVNPSVRAFVFERRDGATVLSLNTRNFGVRGGVRKSGADEAFDLNGNPLSPADLPIGFLPVYLVYSNRTAEEAAAALVRADFYGFDAPLRVSFEHRDGVLTVRAKHDDVDPLSGSIQFRSAPEGWRLDTLDFHDLAPKSVLEWTFPTPETTLSWDKDYAVEYIAVVEDSLVTRRVKLPSLQIPRATPVIDGRLDDWTGLPRYELGDNNVSKDFSEGRMPRQGEEDLFASFSAAWDPENLYVSIRVTDDHFFPGYGEEGLYWQFDSVQLYFDMKNDGGERFNENDAAYTIGFGPDGQPVVHLDKNPSGRYVGASNADRGVDDAVRVAWTKTDDGFIFEIAFPKETLPFLDLAPGSVFGLSLLVNDNDGDGRKPGLTLGPKGTEPFNQPAIWKAVRLEP
ncbi:MAG: sugar-binding protein, partial [Kiritimatiellia bacterium]|nr:sugar-binding protein [Kiritimatiellia bacterium]